MTTTPTTEMAALLEEVRQMKATLSVLEDRAAIESVLKRYARAVDRDDLEALDDVFHTDAVIRMGEHWSSSDGARTFGPHNVEMMKLWSHTTHHINVTSIDISGDVAHTESYIWYSVRRADGAKIDIGAGRYIDRLERRERRWKVAARTLLIDMMGVITPEEGIQGQHGGRRDRTDPSYQRPLLVEA